MIMVQNLVDSILFH